MERYSKRVEITAFEIMTIGREGKKVLILGIQPNDKCLVDEEWFAINRPTVGDYLIFEDKILANRYSLEISETTIPDAVETAAEFKSKYSIVRSAAEIQAP